MTLILGLICRDHIVLASERQTTYGSSKRFEADKILKIRFSNHREVLIAQAGDSATSSRLIEIMEWEAHKISVTNARDISALASSNSAQTRSNFVRH